MSRLKDSYDAGCGRRTRRCRLVAAGEGSQRQRDQQARLYCAPPRGKSLTAVKIWDVAPFSHWE